MSRNEPARGKRIDIHEQITARIIADLETGVTPWTRPWRTSSTGLVSRPLRHSGEPYRGINVVLLWIEAMTRGYASPRWMTYRQALSLGGHVRKGETGTTVVYADRITRTESDDAGAQVERHIPFLKAHSVFNVDQIEGLSGPIDQPAPVLDDAQRIASAERFFAHTGIEISHGGDVACYAPVADRIHMPAFAAFSDPHAYYATLAHEAGHATGHPTRLARAFSKRFGDDAYAREELVSELCAAFLCADLGLTLEPRPDHASYIGHWLKVLDNDRRFIVSAAAQAQRAADWLADCQPPE